MIDGGIGTHFKVVFWRHLMSFAFQRSGRDASRNGHDLRRPQIDVLTPMSIIGTSRSIAMHQALTRVRPHSLRSGYRRPRRQLQRSLSRSNMIALDAVPAADSAVIRVSGK